MITTTTDRVAAVTSLRAELWRVGYRPIPVFNADAKVASPGKQPLGKEWQRDARRDPPFCVTSPAVQHALNTGILADGLRALDIDIDDRELALRVRNLAIEAFGDTIIRTRKNSGRSLLPYRAAQGSPKKRVLSGCLGKIEVLGHGQQFVALGIHPSGSSLCWSPVEPQQMAVENLPSITEEQITAFFRTVAPMIEVASPAEDQKINGQDHTAADPQADPLRIAAALASIPNSGPPDWEAWNRVGMAVWRATGGSAAGWEAWNAWSARNPAYAPEVAHERWEHYGTSAPTSIGAGSIFLMAAEANRRKHNVKTKPPLVDAYSKPEAEEAEAPWQDYLQTDDRGQVIPKCLLDVRNGYRAFPADGRRHFMRCLWYHPLVRLHSGHPLVPTCTRPASARSDGPGWPQAIA